MSTTVSTTSTVLRIGQHQLRAVLTMPPSPLGLVVFAHGSDSNCVSPRNQKIAMHLHQQNFATLLFDFLDDREAMDRANTFDPELLSQRLLLVLSWVQDQEPLRRLPLGLFGSGTGMTAVAKVAARPDASPKAIVSRGGRTDLVESSLARINAPTLLIVGEWDKMLESCNRSASKLIHGEVRLEVIPEATHLFSEPGKLDLVAEHATKWFVKHLIGTKDC